MLNFQFQGNRKLRDEVTSSRLNAILTELRRIRPVAGRGINVQAEGNGSRISVLDSQAAESATSEPRSPWTIYVSGTEGEGESAQYKLKVQPGTSAFFLPTNWDDEWEADKEQLVYGILDVQTDGQFITGTSIEIQEEPPEEQSPQKFGLEESIQILFGLFKGGKSYNLTGGSNLDLSATAVLATSADPPAQPGESAFDIYYRLQ
jgi:hypothetical protein